MASKVRVLPPPPAFARSASYGWASPIVAKAATPKPKGRRRALALHPSVLAPSPTCGWDTPTRATAAARASALRPRNHNPRQIKPDRPNLVHRRRIGAVQLARGFERGVVAGAVHDVEAKQLLFGLGERTVDHDAGARTAQGAGLLR